MLVAFVVDTSGSMNQREGGGLRLVDLAKAAVEHFLKLRARDLALAGRPSPDLRYSDRYFLLTTEEGPSALKVGWAECLSVARLQEELKNLVACDLSSIGPALKRAFDVLNQHRLQYGYDTYGQGRCPWYIEPAVVILLTDGGLLCSSTGLTLPLTPSPGSELTIEPFRWDQRLFTVLLKPGATSDGGAELGNISSPMSAMSEVTGVVSKLQQVGVVANFERLPEEVAATVPLPAPCHHKLLYVRTNSGTWPIPEAFVPDSWADAHVSSQVLPPRHAQPTILFRTADADPFILKNFPHDEYEVESCALTAALLAHKPTACWQTFIQHSDGSSGPGLPFGYLKVATRGRKGTKAVILVVLPYNYPMLWPLLDELINQHKMVPSAKWRKEFENYLLHIPSYYIPPLKAALKRMGLPSNLVPDHLDTGLNFAISNYLKKLVQQAKLENERLKTIHKPTKDSPAIVAAISSPALLPLSSRKVSAPSLRNYHHLLQRSSTGRLTDRDTSTDASDSSPSSGESWDSTPLSEDTSALSQAAPVACRNVFDIPRAHLLAQTSILRTHITGGRASEIDDESKHSVPIAQMGNYHEVFMKRQPLRTLDEDDRKKRSVFFGNPFVRGDKAGKMANMIDAIDETSEQTESALSAPLQAARVKKKRGAFPRAHIQAPQLAKKSKTRPTSPGPPPKEGDGTAGQGEGTAQTVFESMAQPQSEGDKRSLREEAASSDAGAVNFDGLSVAQGDSIWTAQPLVRSRDTNRSHLVFVNQQIRKRATDIDAVLHRLEALQGNSAERAECVRGAALLARRWKKHQLAQRIEMLVADG